MEMSPMTPLQVNAIVDSVADDMLAQTRPFVTPLVTETERDIRLVVTGSYVSRESRRMLLTCEHVAVVQPMHYRFYGSDDVFEHSGPWTMEKHPVDAAFAPISAQASEACSHQAQFIPYQRFALRHAPTDRAEILFFRGRSEEHTSELQSLMRIPYAV